MNCRHLLLLAAVCFYAADQVSAEDDTYRPTKQQVEQVLIAQAQAWNKGDIDGFMEGYAKVPTLRFASGGTVTYGWKETLKHYKIRYPDRAAMGTLSFTDLDTTVLAPDAALVFGHWRLKTANGEPHGLFTLVFRKSEIGWRIMADHTSAAIP